MKIVVIYDVEGWAQHRYAMGIQKHAPVEYEVCITDRDGYESHAQGANVVYCLSLFTNPPIRPMPGTRLVTSIASHGWMYPRYDPNNWATKGVTRSRNKGMFLAKIRRYDAATCRNRVLEEFIRPHCWQVACIPAGVDRSIFNSQGRIVPDGVKLRVGWCGQQSGAHPRNFKGHAEILKPLMRRLGDRCINWSTNTKTYDNAQSPEQMADWYRGLDVFLCTALAEGTPNPPFEAAGCGAAIVSTDVGQVADWKWLRQADCLIPPPRHGDQVRATIEGFTDRLKELWVDPEACRALGGKAELSIAADYNYAGIAPRVCEFLASVKRK